MKEQTVQLNSGQRMPLLGLGTYALQGRVAEEAILQAVEDGKIAKSRHKSYVAMYQEIKDVKQWQQKNKNA